MKLLKTLLQILIIAAVAVACTGSKKLYKKGMELDKAGLHYEAAQFYIDALQRKSTNSDAVIALKKTGQKVLDEYFATFYQYYADKNLNKAVYAYKDATDFKRKVENVGVKLTAADYYEDYYKEVKTLYIQGLYKEAQEDLDNERFAEAETKLREIQNLEPKFKDVKELTNFAFVEPKYRLALKAFDNLEYRKAYYLFDEIIKASGDYKESKELQAIAKEKGRYTIGVLRSENQSKVGGVESALSGSIVRDLMKFNDPFLVVIDRSNTEKLISEQKLGMSGIIDQNTAAKAGELLGAKAILIGKVVSATKNEGKLKKYSRTGYLGKPVYKVNPETGKKYTVMKYSKVYYTDYEQENEVSCTFQYQLVSTETGEILLSDIVERSSSDEVSYSSFNGDSKYLYKGTWVSQTKAKPNDKIYNSYSAKKELDKQLKNRRDITPTESLANEIYRQISKEVSKKIKDYNPEG